MRKLIGISLLITVSSILCAQDYPRLNLWSHVSKFDQGDSIILVKGIIPEDLQIEYDTLCSESSEDNYVVRNESQLSKDDIDRNLFFIGLTNGFTRLGEFLPPTLKITTQGFRFGPYEFQDSLDVIYLYSDDAKRLFYLGNSMEALRSIQSMMVGMEQYVIVQKHVPTHFGFLNKGKFDKEDHVDIQKARAEKLIHKSTKYYDFYYSPNLWSKAEADSILQIQNEKISHVLKVLELSKPKRRIQSFIYNDKYEKYFLSYTYGYGNVFNGAWQIHTIGKGAIEHESIHQIYNDQCPSHFSFISEGIVGYYYCTINDAKWNENQIFVKENHDELDPEECMRNDDCFWSKTKYGYPFSANFCKYIIDQYGLEKFKSFHSASDLQMSCSSVYNKSLNELVREWKNDLLSTDN